MVSELMEAPRVTENTRYSTRNISRSDRASREGFDSYQVFRVSRSSMTSGSFIAGDSAWRVNRLILSTSGDSIESFSTVPRSRGSVATCKESTGM